MHACSTDEAQELMQCTFTSKLMFQSSSLLCNYAFWGFADCVIDGFGEIPVQTIKSNEVSRKVAIGHVASLADVEANPLGLFAVADIAALTFLGEYTGVLQVHHDGAQTFDAYGVSYPSVYEHGDLYVSASEYGNAIRCINHSFSPNARFVPMIQGGILHIFCVRPIALDRHELHVWKSRGADDVAGACVCDAVHDRRHPSWRAGARELRSGVLEVHWRRPCRCKLDAVAAVHYNDR